MATVLQDIPFLAIMFWHLSLCQGLDIARLNYFDIMTHRTSAFFISLFFIPCGFRKLPEKSFSDEM